MARGREKLAGDLQGVLLTSAQHLQKMAHSQSALLTENEALRRKVAAHELAARMEERGLESELSYQAKVAKLLTLPNEKLATLEQAIELVPGGFRLGSVQADDRTTSGDSEHVSDPLDAFISSQAAYT